MPKLNVYDIAFSVETVAHMNNNPKIKPLIGRLLVAAEIVRQASDDMLSEAVATVVKKGGKRGI